MNIALVNSVILNGGDAGIVYGTCDAIREILPEATISVFAHKYKATSPHYPDLSLRPMLQDHWPGHRQLAGLARRTYPFRSALEATFQGERAFFRELAAQNLIVYCGGGYINDLYTTAVLFRIMQQSLASGVPHMAYAHTIGPFFHRASKRKVVQLLSRFHQPSCAGS